MRELIVAPVREHSRKPDEVYSRIEALTGGPYCELFARQRWAGWHSWGDQADRFKPELPPERAKSESELASQLSLVPALEATLP